MYREYDIEANYAERFVSLRQDGLHIGTISVEEAELLGKELLKAVKEINTWTDEQMEKKEEEIAERLCS